MLRRKNVVAQRTKANSRVRRISIIGARAKSVKGANKYVKIDKTGRISARKSIFSFPK
jgi:hypothetical protein